MLEFISKVASWSGRPRRSRQEIDGISPGAEIGARKATHGPTPKVLRESICGQLSPLRHVSAPRHRIRPDGGSRGHENPVHWIGPGCPSAEGAGLVTILLQRCSCHPLAVEVRDNRLRSAGLGSIAGRRKAGAEIVVVCDPWPVSTALAQRRLRQRQKYREGELNEVQRRGTRTPGNRVRHLFLLRMGTAVP